MKSPLNCQPLKKPLLAKSSPLSKPKFARRTRGDLMFGSIDCTSPLPTAASV